MGKGDKKSRRGKIILGTFGVRRRRKIKAVPAAKPVAEAVEKEIKTKKIAREKAEPKETVAVETKEIKAVKEKAPKVPKAAKEKKEAGETAAEPKAKREKKS